MSYIRRDLDKLSNQMDRVEHPETGLFARMTKLETKVETLPTKGFIIAVVGAIGVLLAVAGAAERFIPVPQPPAAQSQSPAPTPHP
jgi:hypothetical protein